MKRSNQPPFWLMFGAGGMISALIGWMLVFVTGIAAPLDIAGGASLMSYDHVSAFARNWAGKGFIFVVVSLFMWHGAHRIYHTLHDFGIPASKGAWLSCYGVAFAATVTAAGALLTLGF